MELLFQFRFQYLAIHESKQKAEALKMVLAQEFCGANDQTYVNSRNIFISILDVECKHNKDLEEGQTGLG